MENRCLYCGKDDLQEQKLTVKYPRNTHINLTEQLLRILGFDTDEYYSFLPDDKVEYICSSCNIITTQSVFDRDTERSIDQEYSQDQPAAPSTSEEQETLQTALTLLKSDRASEAFDLLLKHSFPFEHTAEFLIYRDISQIIPLLFSMQTGQRYWLLEVLRNNLQHLDAYLPADDDKQFQTLSCIYGALLQLGRERVNSQTDYTRLYYEKSSPFRDTNDQTYRRRADVLTAFAERLEAASQKSERHSLDYLKMALEIWHTCLDGACEAHGHFLLGIDTQMLQLDPSQRKRITAHINQLNPIIQKHDPEFIPRKPHKGVWYITYWSIMLLALAACAVIGFLGILSTRCNINIITSKHFPAFVAVCALSAAAFVIYKKTRRR